MVGNNKLLVLENIDECGEAYRKNAMVSDL